jgi:hypothetical protein
MSSLSPQVHDIVFAKTAKGRAEVVRRSAGLSGRHRSILIMLDGEKTLRNIGTLLPEGEMARIVEILLELELIAPWAEVVVSADVHVEAAELSRIKTMMTDSAETCLGLMASEVVRRVQQARDRPPRTNHDEPSRPHRALTNRTAAAAGFKLQFQEGGP